MKASLVSTLCPLLSVFLSLLPFSPFSRILYLPLSYFICNLTPYLYNPLLPSFSFSVAFILPVSLLYFYHSYFILFLISLLFFVPSYSHHLSLSITFSILHLSLFLRY